MTTLGTALTPNAIKVMMLGSGELGKEVVIELQRLGVEVIAVDRYENAPAQQVAHRAYTISMLDGAALKTLVEKERVIHLIETRLGTRQPVAYLTNSAWFCGSEFYVDERTIVPRSPIGELIMQKFAGLIDHEPKRILDMCTGSGCIAIATAEAFPEAEVDAVDLSVDALNVAEINIARHQLEHRVFPIQSDLFQNLFGQQYDLIVTNPPYVDEEDLADMPEEFHYEPELALGSGVDGLEITKQILKQAPDYLTQNGMLVCEVGNSMVSLIEQYPDVPFEWVELKNGGLGVFAISREDLVKYHDSF